MRAVGKNIIVKPIHEETEEKIGSIIVPGNAVASLGKGKVISVGKGVSISHGKELEPEIWIDDIIMFHMHACIPITIQGEEHFVMQIENIILSEEV